MKLPCLFFLFLLFHILPQVSSVLTAPQEGPCKLRIDGITTINPGHHDSSSQGNNPFVSLKIQCDDDTTPARIVDYLLVIIGMKSPAKNEMRQIGYFSFSQSSPQMSSEKSKFWAGKTTCSQCDPFVIIADSKKNTKPPFSFITLDLEAKDGRSNYFSLWPVTPLVKCELEDIQNRHGIMFALLHVPFKKTKNDPLQTTIRTAFSTDQKGSNYGNVAIPHLPMDFHISNVWQTVAEQAVEIVVIGRHPEILNGHSVLEGISRNRPNLIQAVLLPEFGKRDIMPGKIVQKCNGRWYYTDQPSRMSNPKCEEALELERVPADHDWKNNYVTPCHDSTSDTTASADAIPLPVIPPISSTLPTTTTTTTESGSLHLPDSVEPAPLYLPKPEDPPPLHLPPMEQPAPLYLPDMKVDPIRLPDGQVSPITLSDVLAAKYKETGGLQVTQAKIVDTFEFVRVNLDWKIAAAELLGKGSRPDRST